MYPIWVSPINVAHYAKVYLNLTYSLSHLPRSGPSVGKPSSLYQLIFTYIRTNISLFKTKKVEQLINGGFVVFSIFRNKEECDGTDDPEMED